MKQHYILESKYLKMISPTEGYLVGDDKVAATRPGTIISYDYSKTTKEHYFEING